MRTTLAGKVRPGSSGRIILSHLAGTDASGHCLGDLHKHPKFVRLRQMEELLAAGRYDEIARINIANRDRTGKRSCHTGK